MNIYSALPVSLNTLGTMDVLLVVVLHLRKLDASRNTSHVTSNLCRQSTSFVLASLSLLTAFPANIGSSAICIKRDAHGRVHSRI